MPQRDPRTETGQTAIEREALDWVVRLTAGGADPAQLAEARRWAAQSPRHAAAFAQARRLYRLAGTPPRRRWPRLAGAGLALAAALYLALPAAWLADYRSGTGEVRHIHLADGSTAILNARSAIDVHYDGQHRDIELLDGEALFEVQADAARPFSVRGLDVTATALGTTYAVRRAGERMEVLVAHGKVAVRIGASEPATLLAGDRAVARPDAVAVERGVDLAAALAWREGRLVFQQTPLREVVDALNRHRPGHVFLADDALAALPISGVFQLNHLDDALASLSSAFPIDQLQVGSLAVLYPAGNP